jgi:cell division protein FtsI (penicillin-binding protein 3)
MGKRETTRRPRRRKLPAFRPGDRENLQLEGVAKQAMETGRNRLVLAAALFALAFGVIALRLVDVAVLQRPGEPRLARSDPTNTLRMERADILDRNGTLLATSLDTASLYANPHQVFDPAGAAAALASVLPDLNVSEVTVRLRKDRSFVWLRRNLTPRQKYDVNRLGIPGLYFQREQRRVYPHGRLTSHAIGFTGVDNDGLAGIERRFDDTLRHGSEPLRLALDLRVQHILHQELTQSMAEFRARGAAGIVMDTDTGEVVAMVSLPDFDPNDPGAADPESRFNRITLGVYEMGSTFKLFTAAMALDSGRVTLKGGYDASRPIRVSRFVIRDYKPKNRWLSVPEILVYSSNIGAAKMALDVGTEGQRAFLQRLGMLTASAIEVPEVGTPLTPSPWREINTMTVGFGHGLSVSPVNLASGVSALINGGFMMPATLIQRPADAPPVGKRVIKTHTSTQLRWLMRLVVRRGTGKRAAAPGYLVGGKTGSAEKAGRGGYRKRALLSSFVGAFPMDEPRYVVLALLDEPKGNKSTYGYATGGWVAAPIIGRVIRRMAPLLGIEPVKENLKSKPGSSRFIEANARVNGFAAR